MSGVLVVLANSVESREDEFNDWYSGVHVPEILALPSFLSARRFRTGSSRSDEQPSTGT